MSNLLSQTQNVQKISKITQDSLPQVKVNHRVVEGLYLTLNEYATCQWPSDLPKQNLDKVMVQFNDYFPDLNSAVLPIIDEEKQEYGYYSLATQSTALQMYQADEKPHYQPSITVASSGLIYLVGGVNP